jgi:hypothetical protein
MAKLSQSPWLRILAAIFATIWLGFGINALIRPRNAFEVFEFPLPASVADQKVIDGLMIIYGARDVFMGVAVYLTTYYGSRPALGWILIAGSSVAFVDGAVCFFLLGRGQWNHWGYAPVLAAVGGSLLGILD